MKPTVRTFVAIDIATDIKTLVKKAIRPLTEVWPGIRWVDDSQFHITLKFLGDVPTCEIHEVIEAVHRAAEKTEAFDLILEGLGAFPDLNKPRSVWIGISEGLEELQDLARTIETELAPLGFHPENRPFTPHVTIGRVKQPKTNRGEKFNPKNPPIVLDSELFRQEQDRFFGSSPVDEIVVYASELFPDGPRYEVLGAEPLRSLDNEEE